MSGFKTWACFCGACGLGADAELSAHVATHPRFRMWLGKRLLRLARGLEEAGRWLCTLSLRRPTP